MDYSLPNWEIGNRPIKESIRMAHLSLRSYVSDSPVGEVAFWALRTWNNYGSMQEQACQLWPMQTLQGMSIKLFESSMKIHSMAYELSFWKGRPSSCVLLCLFILECWMVSGFFFLSLQKLFPPKESIFKKINALISYM